MVPPLHCTQAKTFAKLLLAILLGISSMVHVMGLCLKFFSGSTTVLMDHEHNEYLPMPKFLLCNKQHYKKDELTVRGLPVNFFQNRHPDVTDKNVLPDLNATWQKATWSLADFEVNWWRFEGNDIINKFTFPSNNFDMSHG